MKAGASMDVRVRGRGAAGVVNGRDAYVYLSGGFGEMKGGAVDAQYQTLLDLAHPCTALVWIHATPNSTAVTTWLT
ncbi:MAG: hypothetical protein IPF71_16145 [Rhodoferax sp.]|nr:hypothetical protein [Rhodoferax sp.]